MLYAMDTQTAVHFIGRANADYLVRNPHIAENWERAYREAGFANIANACQFLAACATSTPRE